MTEVKKENRGGKRQGSGRKPSIYKFKTIAFRIRCEWESELKNLVNDRILELKELI